MTSKLSTELVAHYSRNRGPLEVPRDRTKQLPAEQVRKDEHVEYMIDPTSRGQVPLMYDAWAEFLSSSGPYTQLLTLSFVRPYCDGDAIRGMAQFARFMNRELWGPRWSNKKRGLSGTVIAEPHRISLDLRGRLHFHTLLRPHDQSKSSLLDAAARSAARLRDSNGMLMSDSSRYDLRDIYEIDGLASYLTKAIQTADWASGENILFLEPSGLIGNVLPERHNTTLRASQ